MTNCYLESNVILRTDPVGISRMEILVHLRREMPSIQSIYSKLEMRVFDVYANILKCMYSTRFSGASTKSEASPEAQSTPIIVTPLIRTIDTSRPDKHKRRRKESHEAKDK